MILALAEDFSTLTCLALQTPKIGVGKESPLGFQQVPVLFAVDEQIWRASSFLCS